MALREWGAYAHSLVPRSPLCTKLEHWYEALKLLVISWEEAADMATAFLRMNVLGAGAISLDWPPAAHAARTAFLRTLGDTSSFPRFAHLIDCLKYKLEEMDDFRGILFVEQRVSTHILEHVIASDPELGPRVATASLYASSSPATSSLAVSKRDVAARLAAFSSGRVSLLITTVVAEEGMDVPAANCVIRFDAMLHAVSFVQGRGRARAADSRFLVLSERPDRPASLLVDISSTSWGVAPATALAALKGYCQKTKVELQESFQPRPNGFQVLMTYKSCLRSISVQADASSKAEAKRQAASQLIQALMNGSGATGQ
ncbi:hypothetical protein FOA52_006978 [Chlamydomonas sp. UWO 241]|nr:hypothetical protein FOA52_006978 [Chlamydomonas sp. UWO 241]